MSDRDAMLAAELRDRAEMIRRARLNQLSEQQRRELERLAGHLATQHIPAPVAPEGLHVGATVTLQHTDTGLTYPGLVVTAPDSAGYLQISADIIRRTMSPWASMGYHITTGQSRLGPTRLIIPTTNHHV